MSTTAGSYSQHTTLPVYRNTGEGQYCRIVFQHLRTINIITKPSKCLLRKKTKDTLISQPSVLLWPQMETSSVMLNWQNSSLFMCHGSQSRTHDKSKGQQRVLMSVTPWMDDFITIRDVQSGGRRWSCPTCHTPVCLYAFSLQNCPIYQVL